MNFFRNLKISVRLLVSFIIVALISAVIGTIGIINIDNLNKADIQMYEKNVQPLDQLVTMAYDFGAIRSRVKDVLLSSKLEDIKKYKTEVDSYSTNFDRELNEFYKNLLTQAGKTATDELKSSKEKFMDDAQQVMELKENRKDQEAMVMTYSTLRTAQDNVEKALKKISTLKSQNAKLTSENNDKTASTNRMITLVFMVVGIILAMILGVIISQSISKPIKKLIKEADEIAVGNLDVNINLGSKDEIGALARSFQTMANKLNEVLNNINVSSNQVAIGSKQVSDSSIALSQGAAEQASSVEELTSSIEEISSQTKLNADNAKEADELSSSVKENAENGNEQMQQMLVSMEEINASSGNISKIIKVIDDIAFQTNILALNAAVEAARAGQHGKGFAVVAEEVRNLAARSASAAKETTEMIENSIKKVESGTKIANETAQALDEIVTGIAKVSEFINQISVASTEQSSALQQINQGVIQVSQVVQENSATSEQSAAASEELAEQAKFLQEQVLQFKLKKLDVFSEKHSEKDINPEVLNMLKAMNKNNGAAKEAAVSKTDSIDLSDREFGKY